MTTALLTALTVLMALMALMALRALLALTALVVLTALPMRPMAMIPMPPEPHRARAPPGRRFWRPSEQLRTGASRLLRLRGLRGVLSSRALRPLQSAGTGKLPVLSAPSIRAHRKGVPPPQTPQMLKIPIRPSRINRRDDARNHARAHCSS